MQFQMTLRSWLEQNEQNWVMIQTVECYRIKKNEKNWIRERESDKGREKRKGGERIGKKMLRSMICWPSLNFFDEFCKINEGGMEEERADGRF